MGVYKQKGDRMNKDYQSRKASAIAILNNCIKVVKNGSEISLSHIQIQIENELGMSPLFTKKFFLLRQEHEGIVVSGDLIKKAT